MYIIWYVTHCNIYIYIYIYMCVCVCVCVCVCIYGRFPEQTYLMNLLSSLASIQTHEHICISLAAVDSPLHYVIVGIIVGGGVCLRRINSFPADFYLARPLGKQTSDRRRIRTRIRDSSRGNAWRICPFDVRPSLIILGVRRRIIRIIT